MAFTSPQDRLDNVEDMASKMTAAGELSPEHANGIVAVAKIDLRRGESLMADVGEAMVRGAIDRDQEKEAQNKRKKEEETERSRDRIIEEMNKGGIKNLAELSMELRFDTHLPANDREREQLLARFKKQKKEELKNNLVHSGVAITTGAPAERAKLEDLANNGLLSHEDVNEIMDEVYEAQRSQVRNIVDNLDTLPQAEISARKAKLNPDAQAEIDKAIADRASQNAETAKENADTAEQTRHNEHVQQIEDALDEDNEDIDLTEEQLLNLIDRIRLPKGTKDRKAKEERLREKYRAKLRERALESTEVQDTLDQVTERLAKTKRADRAGLAISSSDKFWELTPRTQSRIYMEYARLFPGFNELSDIEKQVIIQEAQQRIQELEQIEATEIGKNRERISNNDQYVAIKKDIENLALPQDIKVILGNGVDALKGRDSALKLQRKAEMELAEAQKRKLTVDRNIHRLKRYWPIAAGTFIGFGLGVGSGFALAGTPLTGVLYSAGLAPSGMIIGASLGAIPGIAQNIREGGTTGKEFEAKVRRFELQLEEIKLKQTQDALNQYQEIERLTNDVLSSMGIDRKALQEVLPDFFGTRNLDQFSNNFEPKYYAKPNAA